METEKPSEKRAGSATAAVHKMAAGVDAMRGSAAKLSDSADRRNELAADRTVLAAERTYAAWIRTGLAALASGIGARALLKGIVADWMVGATGSLLIMFSGFCFIAALWRELWPGAPPPKPDTRKLPIWLLLVFNGFLMLVSIAALVGVWSGVDPSR